MTTDHPPPESKARLAVISLILSILTSLIGAIVISSGRGAGMEALGRVFPLIVLGGGGLIVAFLLGVVVMFREEQPRILTILAIVIPPVAGLVAPALGR